MAFKACQFCQLGWIAIELGIFDPNPWNFIWPNGWNNPPKGGRDRWHSPSPNWQEKIPLIYHLWSLPNLGGYKHTSGQMVRIIFHLSLEFPEMFGGFRYNHHHLGAQVVWGRYHLTRLMNDENVFKKWNDDTHRWIELNPMLKWYPQWIFNDFNESLIHHIYR